MNDWLLDLLLLLAVDPLLVVLQGFFFEGLVITLITFEVLLVVGLFVPVVLFLNIVKSC